MDGERTGTSRERTRLRRSLTLLDATMLGIGGVLGAGTYAIIGEATGLSGSLIWLSLLLAALTALLCAGTYAELVSRHPDAGGGYEFVAQGFGRPFANGVGVLLFLTGVIAAATISIAFTQYFARLLPLEPRLVAPLVIFLMGFVNAIGIRGVSFFNIATTVVTLLGLAWVVVAGVPELGSHDLLETSERGTSGILAGAAMAFFAFVGFEDVIKSVEETREPRITMPRALLVSGAVVLFVNVAIAIASVSVVDWTELAGTKGPLSAVVARSFGEFAGVLVTLAALVAMTKTILSNVLGGSRLLYDMGRDTNLPDFLSHVSQKTRTPLPAIALTTILAALISLIGDLGLVATFSNLAVLSLFLLVNLSLLAIRLRERHQPPDSHPPFRLPLNVKNVSVLNLLAIAFVLLLGVYNVGYLWG